MLEEFITIKPVSYEMIHELLKEEEQNMNKMARTAYLSIITLSVNGLNVTIKRYRMAEWIRKQDPYIGCQKGTHFTSKDTQRLKVKEWEKIIHVYGNKQTKK